MINPGLALGIVSVSDNIGQMFDTAGKIIPSIKFLTKWNVVAERLDFVVRAVDGIAEVWFNSSKLPGMRSILCRFTHTPRWPGV